MKRKENTYTKKWCIKKKKEENRMKKGQIIENPSNSKLESPNC